MSEDSEGASGPSQFRTTAWSVVAGAQEEEGARRDDCLAQLCRSYWKPIYYYVRRRGLNHDDARDFTQEYFATFLEKDFVAAADRERGKFRTFVLVTVNRFLSKHLAKQNRRQSRVCLMIPGEGEDGEPLLPELAAHETAEDDFNRRWALSLLEATLERMREHCGEDRRRNYYLVFKNYLDSMSGTKAVSYRELAESVGMSENDVTNYLHRGRNIFQKLLREEIRQSVSSEPEVDEEIEALKEYLRK